MKKNNSTSLFAAALALCVLLLVPSVALAEASSPTNTLQHGIDKMISILDTPAVETDAGRATAIEQLRAMADEYFAFEQLTMRAVGRPWLSMSEENRSQLQASFRKLLELTYMKQIRQYQGQKVLYKRELRQGDKAMVLTEVVAKDKSFSVNYKMIELDGRWLVYDIIGEGISLVKNYRSQFKELLHNGSIEELRSRIDARVAALEAGENK